MSRGGASAEDDAGWDAIGEKDGAIGYEAVLTDQRRQRRRIEHGTDEGQKGVRRGMVGLTLSSSLPLVHTLHTYLHSLAHLFVHLGCWTGAVCSSGVHGCCPCSSADPIAFLLCSIQT